MSIENLRLWLSRSDAIDEREGKLAYARYQATMAAYAERYDTTLEIATAVFCALSPNNDYYGNLRSMASVLEGVRTNKFVDDVRVSTYKHCRARAWSYATGRVDFLDTVKGPKIRSFYLNLIDPNDPEPVTIDGHMHCCWINEDRTMREALVRSKRAYNEIADGCRELAREEGLIPNQLQAILWFTRKRVCNVKYDPRIALFGDATDTWGTFVSPDDAPHY